MGALADDPRWRRFSERAFQCPDCGHEHRGLFDLGVFAPGAWPGAAVYEPNNALRLEGDFLSEDFCVVDGKHFFVRCVLELPLQGSSERFGYGVWSSLSPKNFSRYVAEFDNGFDGEESWFGWFSNRLKAYPDTFNLKCQVRPQPDRQRPLIALEPADHPLCLEQRDGVSFDRLLEIYAENGHDFRAALAQGI